MQKVFNEVHSLDKRCYEEFFLSEDLLMEHASLAISNYIEYSFNKTSSILIVCGSGNNGADGITLARLLHSKYEVKLYLANTSKSKMSKLQLQRAKLLKVNIVNEVLQCDIIIDCLFGTGLNKPLNKDSKEIINFLNSYNSYKIACDIPSGVNNLGQVESVAFEADLTITMGALKTSLFTDVSKDYVGEIIVASLGVQREVYETFTNIFLLDDKDLKLPFREKKNSHKGNYGHLNVVAGCKKGAGVIAAKAAFGFGTGIVSIVCHEEIDLPCHIMQTHLISKNCSAIAIGMGLGKYKIHEVEKILAKKVPIIVDADLLYEEVILTALDKDIVLTPHPKEFCGLLKLCNICEIDINTLQNNRFKYVQMFCKKYPKVVLLLKGANVLISQDAKIYINTFGTATLAKGGSGDVLSGLIASLLAQGYSSLDATISGSLAHTKAASNFKKNNYSLIPSDLIEEVRKL